MQNLYLSHNQRLICVLEINSSTKEPAQAESVDTKIGFPLFLLW